MYILPIFIGSRNCITSAKLPVYPWASICSRCWRNTSLTVRIKGSISANPGLTAISGGHHAPAAKGPHRIEGTGIVHQHRAGAGIGIQMLSSGGSPSRAQMSAMRLIDTRGTNRPDEPAGQWSPGSSIHRFSPDGKGSGSLPGWSWSRWPYSSGRSIFHMPDRIHPQIDRRSRPCVPAGSVWLDPLRDFPWDSGSRCSKCPYTPIDRFFPAVPAWAKTLTTLGWAGRSGLCCRHHGRKACGVLNS
jgi:hypothetical protein